MSERSSSPPFLAFTLATPSGSTRVRVGPRALSWLPRVVLGRRAVLVGDRRVLDLHGRRVRALLGGALLAELALPAGEAAKKPAVAARAWAALARAGCGRDDLLVALGGGAALDAAGFVASTWMRGIAWVALPTTLLAQCDACIGGKTALDLVEGKNLVGSFHPPEAALVDPTFLRTLGARDFRAARFEILKCAWLAADARLERLALGRALARREARATAEAVGRALRVKAALVAGDERDRGERRLLNLGHTFGHALERAAGLGWLRHGEAVGLGLLAASEAASSLGLLPPADLERRRRAVLALAPPRPPARLVRAALRAARLDKKRKAGMRESLVLVLPTPAGAVVCAGLPAGLFRASLERAIGAIP